MAWKRLGSPVLTYGSVTRSVPLRRAAGAQHERLTRVELWEKPPYAGAGDPGSLPAFHGGHFKGVPLLPAAHHTGAVGEGH